MKSIKVTCSPFPRLALINQGLEYKDSMAEEADGKEPSDAGGERGVLQERDLKHHCG